MRIDSATSGLASLTGSFTGSHFGNGAGLTNLSVDAGSVTYPAGWVSGSSQVDFTQLQNKPTLLSSSVQIGDEISGSFDLPLAGIYSYTSSLKSAISLNGTDVTLLGDLTVQGTTTAINSTAVEIADVNILLASGAVNSTAANGAGFTVDGANATLTYASVGDKWVFNKVVDVPTSGLLINNTAVTSTAAELNYLDGADADINTLSLPANTTISTFGASLVDDADAAAARTTLGLGTIATLSSIDISSNTNLGVTDTTGQTGINMSLTGDNISGVVSGLGTSNNVQFNSLGIGTAAPGTGGVIRATNDIIAYYSSDERLKDNITPLHGALEKVNKLGGYEFDWNDKQDVHTGHDIGVKAQEVQAQYPELVHERENGYLAVDYIKLNAVLIEAIKELSEKVRILESK